MEKQFYTTKQIAQLFGVHESTVRRWAEDGHIPVLRFGKSYRFPKALIDAMGQEVPASCGSEAAND